MNDITNHDEVVRLVDAFYAKVRVDALLAPKFAHLDWHNHVPVMYKYWSDLLLGGTTYEGSPFQRHMQLDLNENHFQRWNEIFEETVDELFEGAKATEAKERLRSVSGIFQHKLGILNLPGDPPKSK